MAMESARAPVRLEQLWQVPTFFLGVACLVCVWFARPSWQPTAAERVRRDLQILKSSLESPQTSPEQLERLLTRIAKSPTVEWTSERHNLAAQGYIRLGEANDNPEAANPFWQSAKQHLEAVKASELTPEETTRWNFRMAKLMVRDKSSDPAQVLAVLTANLPMEEDRAEGYRLMADCYLRMTPPNEVKARDSLRDYLRFAPPRTRGSLLSAARLEIGRISLRVNDIDEARKTLERVGPDSPPGVYAAARTGLAKTFLQEGDWSQALRYLEQARETKGIDDDVLLEIRFELANVYLRANRKDEAVNLLTELRGAPGGIGQAARLKLVLLKGIDPANSEELLAELERAATNINAPSHGGAALKTPELRETCDQAYAAFVRDRRFDLAERVARLYAYFAEPGRDKTLLVETYKAWSASLPEGDQKRELLHKAAQQVSLLAAMPGVSANQKKDWLKQSIELELQAGDPKAALARLDETVQLLGGPDSAGPDLWLRRGQLYVAANDIRGAAEALERGLKQPGNQEIALRAELAECYLRESRPKDAIEQLELNLKNPELQNQASLRERTLFSLGDSYFRLHEWAKAIERYEEAVAYYSETGLALTARSNVGHCHMYLAWPELNALRADENELRSTALTEQQHSDLERKVAARRRTCRDHLASARKAFQEVVAKLDTSDVAKDPKTQFGKIRFSAAMGDAQCALAMGDYEASRAAYDKMIDLYLGKVEQLIALGQLYQCHEYQGQVARAQLVLTQIRTAYNYGIKDDAYDDSTPNRTKKYWAEWLESKKK